MQFEINEEAAALRKDLHESKVPSVLGKSNLRHYDVKWVDGGVDTKADDSNDHYKYLQTFCQNYVDDTKRLIKSAVKAKKESTVLASEYYTEFDEALHHLHFCSQKCATFRGQDQVLQNMKQFLSANKRKPLVIHAESGVGKTSIMAMAMKKIPEWFGNGCIRIIQFLGTSPSSQDIYSVVKGFAGQLADTQGVILEPVGYTNMTKLNSYLPRFLRLISRSLKHPAFIFLDSIDQLTPSDNAYSMKWLPLELPQNIHIIISTLPREYNILNNLKKRLPGEDCYIEVKPLPESTGKEIIDAYLTSKKRTITEEQHETILQHLQRSPSPLFLKLLLDQAVMWKSYTPMSEIQLGSSVREAINMLFDRLEGKFGKLLVSRALGYMTVGVYGLTEVELEDMLSCDNEVLSEVYQYHDPPVEGVVRIPPLLWARTKQDFAEYVTERISYGKNTIYWYHRQFIEAAQDRYTKGEVQHVLHGNLAELYMADKPVKKGIKLAKRKLDLAEADRQVALQPKNAKNRRMFVSLIHHLVYCGDISKLHKFALCNLEFMMIYIKGFGLTNLIKEYQSAIERLKVITKFDYELELIQECLYAMKSSLKSADLLPVELVARLRAESELYPALHSLLVQAKEHMQSQPSPTLLPMFPCLTDPGLLKWTISGCQRIHQLSNDGTVAVLQLQPSEAAPIKPGYADFAQQVLIDDLLKASADQEQVLVNLDVENNTVYAARYAFQGKGDKGIHSLVLQQIITTDPTIVKTTTLKIRNTTVKVMPQSLKVCDGYVMVVDEEKHLSLLRLKDEKVLRSTKWMDVDYMGFVQSGSVPTPITLSQKSDQHFPDISTIKNQVTTVHIICTAPELDKVDNKTNTKYKGKKNIVLFMQGKIDINTVCFMNEQQMMVSFYPDQEQLVFVDLSKRGEELFNQNTTVGCRAVEVCVDVGHKSCPPFVVNSSELLVALKPNIVSFITYPPGGDTREFPLADHLEVTYLVMDASGEHVIIGTKLGEAVVCRHATLEMVGKYKLHNGAINMISISMEDDLMVTYTEEKELKVWNYKQFLQTCVNGNQATKSPDVQIANISESLETCENIEFVLFTEDGAQILTGTLDAKIKVWDSETGNLVKIIDIPGDIKNIIPVCKSTHILVQFGEGKLGLWNIDTADEIGLDQLTGAAEAITVNQTQTVAYVLLREEHSKMKVALIDVPSGKCSKTIQVKDKLTSTDEINIKVSDNEKYLVFQRRCNAKEWEIIKKSEKKLQMGISSGNMKFHSLNLSKDSASLQICNRILTKVSSLGVSWEVHLDSSIVIGKDRLTVLWDMNSDKCDQRVHKGNIMFYRPGVMEKRDGPQVCHGRTLCMAKSRGGSKMAVGSEDGWMVVYGMESGVHMMDPSSVDAKKPYHEKPVRLIFLLYRNH